MNAFSFTSLLVMVTFHPYIHRSHRRKLAKNEQSNSIHVSWGMHAWMQVTITVTSKVKSKVK